jgi:threonine aldolase
VIELRSDTATKPSPAMREAMATAEVGDEQRREDPTVNELERHAADLLGQEEAVYLPTATMANQIALRILTKPGQELLAEESSHIFGAELGGAAVHSGLAQRSIESENGRFAPEQVRAKLRDWGSFHTPATTVIALEDTHNSSGGCFWRMDEVGAVAGSARELGLKLHLDGARLFNGAVARGVPAAEFAGLFDTVSICLSKGLGAPLGALIAGSAELMREARWNKHLFGGAMRQAGIVAAGGLYALRHNVDRLAEDHARARRLADGLVERGVAVRGLVETNFVQIDVGADRKSSLARLREEGVMLSTTIHPTVVRAVTHLDVGDEDIDEAIERIPRALGALVGA